VRVLVTGSDGYIGTLLPPILEEHGHECLGIDAGFYQGDPVFLPREGRPPTLRQDVRKVDASQFEGVDAVVHMAELSNDPLGQLAPETTMDINHRGSVHVAKTALSAGVTRFIYMSSCSVYGIAEEDMVDEESPVRPQTMYAQCKHLVERDVAALATDNFSPTFLRNATAYGASPNMRFDIVLNNLCGLAWTTGIIALESDGTPWRPLVHAADICRAIAEFLAAPRDRVHNQVVNVGALGANFQVRELAEVVASVFEGCELSIGAHAADNRSYRVSFDKLRELLPSFRCTWTPRQGAQELQAAFEQISLSEELFRSNRFTRLRQIERLRETDKLDPQLYWREPDAAPAAT
jgi:nucleoside-diphosphate-sugar epimerase